MLTYQVVDKHGNVFKIKTNIPYSHCILTYLEGQKPQPHWCTIDQVSALSASLRETYGVIETLPATVDGDN